MHTSTSGGINETDVNEFTVMPWGAPAESNTVVMATPVVNWAHALRKASGPTPFLGTVTGLLDIGVKSILSSS
jgi:hypothetical protein